MRAAARNPKYVGDNLTTSFKDLGLSEATLAAIKRQGFTTPTPVQEQAIPVALAGRDVVAAAKTGTGKTAAFALPIIERIGRSEQPGAPRALIVSPTRELAQQIDRACFALSKNSRHRIFSVIGGTSYRDQITKLKRGVDILVATPGRLYDLMERRVVDLSKIEVLVLDEADRMLDMGFWPTVKKIVAATPSSRQTLFFSATLDRTIMKDVNLILDNPVFVEIAHRGETADEVDQYIMPTSQTEKPHLLRAVLEDKGAERIIVFTRTKSRSDTCTRQLCKAGFRAESIHSNKSQAQRKRALDNFSKGRINILVATDVLARGIDVSQVENVINYDLPDSPEDYVHRIGRTGRAGNVGKAISFVSPDTKCNLRDIERLIGGEIPALSIEGYDNSEAMLAFEKQRVTQQKKRTAASFSRDVRTTGRNNRGGRPSAGRPSGQSQKSSTNKSGNGSKPANNGRPGDGSKPKSGTPNRSYGGQVGKRPNRSSKRTHVRAS